MSRAGVARREGSTEISEVTPRGFSLYRCEVVAVLCANYSFECTERMRKQALLPSAAASQLAAENLRVLAEDLEQHLQV